MTVLRVSDVLSHTGLRLQMVNHDRRFVCSGFAYEYMDELFLVTALHNVTGRHAETGESLSADAVWPKAAVVNVASRVVHEEVLTARQRDEDGEAMFVRRGTEIDLYEDADCHEPRWLVHPEHTSRVDLCALPFPLVDEMHVVPVNAPGVSNPRVPITAGMDVFILGYPIGLHGGAGLPLWKRGSIASEPDFNFLGLPLILVDTATRPGMSGAPVFAEISGFWTPLGATGGTKGISDEATFGSDRRFVGIYTGRVDNDTLGAQIGFAWKATAIEAVIAGGVRGASSFHA